MVTSLFLLTEALMLLRVISHGCKMQIAWLCQIQLGLFSLRTWNRRLRLRLDYFVSSVAVQWQQAVEWRASSVWCKQFAVRSAAQNLPLSRSDPNLPAHRNWFSQSSTTCGSISDLAVGNAARRRMEGAELMPGVYCSYCCWLVLTSWKDHAIVLPLYS